jgi:ribosomal protein L7/L12
MNKSAGALPYSVIQALKQGQTIEAIKRLRNLTGLGLKEAKEAIDAYQNDDSLAPLVNSDGFSPPLFEALQSGNKLEAIRILHAQGSHSLIQAKEFVDAYFQKNVLDSTGVVTDHQVPDDLLDALRTGEKLLSIKLLREQTGLGLKEAKDAIEALPLQMNHKIEALQRLYVQANIHSAEVRDADEKSEHEKTSAKTQATRHFPTIEKPRSNTMLAWFIGTTLLACALYYGSQNWG